MAKSQDHFRPAKNTQVDKNMFFVRFGNLEIFFKKSEKMFKIPKKSIKF